MAAVIEALDALRNKIQSLSNGDTVTIFGAKNQDVKFSFGINQENINECGSCIQQYK